MRQIRADPSYLDDPEIAPSQAVKKKINLLLFELENLLNDPPIEIDLYSWIDDVDRVMDKINENSPHAFSYLESLVLEAEKRAEEHVRNLDEEEEPHIIEESRNLYFEQVGFTLSEINSLKFL